MTEAVAETETSGWLTQRERGTRWLVRFTFRLGTLVGRTPMKVPVHIVAMWYRLFDRAAVRASKDWLTRVHGKRPGFWAVYAHIRTFVQVTMDRMFFATGRTRSFTFTQTGHEILEAQLATGRGALLLGAHLGSYEVLRFRSTETNVPMSILGFFENAAQINALIEELDPANAARVIHIGQDPVRLVMQVKNRLDAGELAGVLGDRVGLNDRAVEVEFFGAKASFAGGPFLLAASLGCPVYITCGLYRSPNRYDLHCEPFADRIELPRRRRGEELQGYVQKYAERLEHYCRLAPDNWFNFFDFWNEHGRPQET